MYVGNVLPRSGQISRQENSEHNFLTESKTKTLTKACANHINDIINQAI